MKILITIIGIINLYFLIEYIYKYKYKPNTLIKLKNKIINKSKKLTFIKMISSLLKNSGISFKMKGINIISSLNVLILSILFFSVIRNIS